MVFIEIHYKHTSVLFNTYKNTYKNPVLELCSICRKKQQKAKAAKVDALMPTAGIELMTFRLRALTVLSTLPLK